MRLRAILFAVLALAAAAAGAWKLGELATARTETETAGALKAALAVSDQGWATAMVDGLKVTLAGAAPDEASHFRALEAARQAVDGRRIVDVTTIAAAKPLPPPPFALELLRDEGEVSLIGLVPDTGGRDVISAALRAGGLAANVTDMLESASEPAPDGWQPALGFGLSVLADLPRAKVSVEPGAVRVVAVADSDADRLRLQERLQQARPQAVTLALDITAPKAAIVPFAFDMTLAGGSARLDACSAESDAAAAAILAAARAAGAPADAACAVGLGVPSPAWDEAVAKGIAALRALGGGRFALADTTANLTPAAGAPGAAAAADALGAALPAPFQLAAAVPAPAAPADATAPGDAAAPAALPPEFEAELAADGAVRLSGAVPDATSRDAILSYAAALFGHDRVLDATEVAAGMPAGWPGRVLAGLDGLAALTRGTLTVTPEAVAVSGWGIDAGVREKVVDVLAAKVGQEAKVDVTYNAAAAAAAEQAARPKPEICADQIAAILAAGSIQFAAGSADIVPESKGIIAGIADVLRSCPGADFEIGGHTDSQGPAEANQRLSDRRAQAVLAALRAEDLPAVGLAARGYGASRPVADNDTDAGRARNRRIEFTLVTPEQLAEEATAGDAAAAENVAEEEAEAGASCEDEIGAILADHPLQFEGGVATLAAASDESLTAIAGALGTCPEARFEIGGYTDSQGSDDGNLSLSQSRAEAVLAALRSKGAPLAGSVAKGYGEADPVADNATADGRAQNRRIAFVPLADPAPEVEAPAAAAGGEGAPAAEGEAAADGGADAACVAGAEAVVAATSIAFAAGSAELAPESGKVLDAVATALKACPDAALEVAGHTDAEGSEAGNLKLSQGRAEAVLAALRSRGLALPNATATGYGESRPVADNATAEGRAQNRRIALALAAPAEEQDGDDGDAGQE